MMTRSKEAGSRWKTLLSLFCILGAIAITLWLAFGGHDPTAVWQTICTLDAKWLGAAFLCWLGAMITDALWLQCYFRFQGKRLSTAYSMFVAVVGAFYCAVTPGASGGQPMQIYYLSKKDIPVGMSTSAVSLRFMLSHFSTVLLTVVIVLLCQSVMAARMVNVQGLIAAGWLVHLAGSLLVLLSATWKTGMQKAAGWLVRAGGRLHIVRSEHTATGKLNDMIEAYHANIRAVSRHPVQLLVLTGLSVASLFLTVMIPLCIYYAFGGQQTSAGELLTISYMLHLSASYFPMPGASGAQEGGFLVFFRDVFPAEHIGLAMLIWRFFSYYLHLIAGPVLLAIRSFSKKNTAADTLSTSAAERQTAQPPF